MSGFLTLSRAEMRNVLGGYAPPPPPPGGDCASGQTLYSCVQEGKCATTGGVVCATSSSDAESKVQATLTQQGTWGDDCWNTVWCD